MLYLELSELQILLAGSTWPQVPAGHLSPPNLRIEQSTQFHLIITAEFNFAKAE